MKNAIKISIKIAIILLAAMSLLTACAPSPKAPSLHSKLPSDDDLYSKNDYEKQEDSFVSAVSSGAKKSLINPEGLTVESRIITPDGFVRTGEEEASFAGFLRKLPLKPDGSKVKLYNGKVKLNNVHQAVLDIDVGNRDLQQCADAAIRLRAEYLYTNQQYSRIHFNFTNGFNAQYEKWMEGNRIKVEGNDCRWVKTAEISNDYASFKRYLEMVFAYAGTLSLSQEMKNVAISEAIPGDVFVEGGSPGHAVIILDMAEDISTGQKLMLLAQSYMPAQDIHILKNFENSDISPWYPLDFGERLITPEWEFDKNQLMRFTN